MREIEIFRKLPYAIRRYIILLMKALHPLGWQLSRPRALDLRRVRPQRDLSTNWADLFAAMGDYHAIWLGLDINYRKYGS